MTLKAQFFNLKHTIGGGIFPVLCSVLYTYNMVFIRRLGILFGEEINKKCMCVYHAFMCMFALTRANADTC